MPSCCCCCWRVLFISNTHRIGRVSAKPGRCFSFSTDTQTHTHTETQIYTGQYILSLSVAYAQQCSSDGWIHHTPGLTSIVGARHRMGFRHKSRSAYCRKQHLFLGCRRRRPLTGLSIFNGFVYRRSFRLWASMSVFVYLLAEHHASVWLLNTRSLGIRNIHIHTRLCIDDDDLLSEVFVADLTICIIWWWLGCAARVRSMCVCVCVCASHLKPPFGAKTS